MIPLMPQHHSQVHDARWVSSPRRGAAPVAALELDAEECQVRLRELQHRTRNDLQLIHSLALRHARGAADPAAKAGFEAIGRYVYSLARLYGDLLRAQPASDACLDEHLRRLCATIVEAKALRDRGIELAVEAEPVRRDPESVTALGLAINELIANAVEHAFADGRSGRIAVRLAAGPDGPADTATLRVADDGPGFADPSPGEPAFGLGIAQWLVRRAGGTLVREAAEGTAWRITLS